MSWAGFVLLLLAMYFLSSGAAFVATFKYPGKAPTRFFGWFYKPLDWLARRNLMFQSIYNGFQTWCYKRFVNRRQSGDAGND